MPRKILSATAGLFGAGMSSFRVFLSFFLLLLLFNTGWWFNPPHWDEILGLHNQAVFLAKHHFSFSELWRPEQHSFEGSDVYRFGILPLLYAVLYSFLPPVWVHLTGHLFNMACIAGAGTLMVGILRKNGVSAGTALLWAIAVFCEPLIAGRSAALGQECALIFCVMLALEAFLRKRWYAAFGILLLGGLVKGSAAVACLALLLGLVLRMVLRKEERKRVCGPLIAGGICLLLLLALLQHNVDFAGGGLHLGGPVRDGGRSGWIFLLKKGFFHYELYFPVLFSVILAGGGAFAVRWIRERKKIPSEDFLFQCALLLTVLGFVGAYLMARIALPRYMAAASFPAFLLLALNLPRFRRSTAVLLIPIGLLAPLFYKELPFGIRRSGEYLERSREYLSEIAANRRLCSFLERFREDPVVVSWPLAQMLTMPEMGYVKKPFPKVYSGRVPFYAPVRKLEKPYGKMPPETVFVYHENDFENTGMSGPSLLPDRTCVSLYRDTTLGGLVIVYRRENPVSGPVRESQPRAE